MKEKLKDNRIDIYISSAISMVIGILFIVFPTGMESLLSIIVGVGVLVVAVFMLIGALIAGVGNAIWGIIITILLGIIGVWILLNPLDFARIIPIAVGIMIVIHGISDFITSFTVKGLGVKTWWIMLIGSILSIAFGLICIFYSFGVLTVSFIFMGVMLILDSIITFIVTIRSSKYRRNINGDVEVKSKVVK